MIKDLNYYAKKREKYEDALLKLRKMINQSTAQINVWLQNIILYKKQVSNIKFEKETRKRDSLLKQYGRIQSILQILDNQRNVPTFDIIWTIYNNSPPVYHRELRI